MQDWFDRWIRNRRWATSEWGRAWERFVQVGHSDRFPEYRQRYEKAEIERRSREHD